MKKDTKSLHIVFLDFDDIKNSLLSGGQARATLEVGSRLVKRGHRVTVITSKFPSYANRTQLGIRYKHIGLGSGNIKLNNIAYILTLPFTIMRLRADVIIECFTAPISTLFSPLFTSIPVVALPTSFDAERFTKIYHFPFLWIEKFGLRFYKFALPFTQSLENKFKDINPAIQTRIVPQGVGSEYFSIKKHTRSYMLFLGRLDINQKGIDLLLAAYKKACNQINHHLIIAGDGPDRNKVKLLIEQLKLENRVKMIGNVSGRKKMDVLSKSVFVCMPSRSEGFPLFALEALASGSPIVAFNIPALSWGRSPLISKAKAFDINEYANLLKKISKSLTPSLSEECQALARKYTWSNVTDNFESFIQEVVLKGETK